eukprot:361114-Chlamydomonas_euryale.AAC.9
MHGCPHSPHQSGLNAASSPKCRNKADPPATPPDDRHEVVDISAWPARAPDPVATCQQLLYRCGMCAGSCMPMA